jgi:uncharacterized ferritin-like protein (DUF455 family)
MPENLYQHLLDALLEKDPTRKCDSTLMILDRWKHGQLVRNTEFPIQTIDIPGKPDLPGLVDPRQLSRRTTSSREGRISLLHAFAHIEFNAINIALDAAYRFRQMPDRFVSDWLLVASEEAKHFSLLSEYLCDQGTFYGGLDAHSGLWDMVCKTRHEVLHRMAMVPRVMEARGLDVTPGMIKRFTDIGDQRAVDILEVIYRDEVGHVRIGNHWFRYLCQQRGLDLIDTFRELVDSYLGGGLRGPFNWKARLEAGFEAAELKAMEQELGR